MIERDRIDEIGYVVIAVLAALALFGLIFLDGGIIHAVILEMSKP